MIGVLARAAGLTDEGAATRVMLVEEVDVGARAAVVVGVLAAAFGVLSRWRMLKYFETTCQQHASS
eukprot:33627-Eustigmatos_ZCMA.PRE.1